jgi:hypothetical protein
MHAATVELLVKKARLEPDIALAFAEAMDLGMVDAQLVTVPILDSRFAKLEGRLDARFAAVDGRFAAIDARFTALEGRLDDRLLVLEAKMGAG